MIRKKVTKKQRPRIPVIANFRIGYPQVMLIGEEGENIGILDTDAAIRQAFSQEKDLVLITDKSTPPVCKIIELSKHKYQLQQKDAESRKKSKVQGVKEVRFSVFIGENDFNLRINKIKEFIRKGHKVRLTLTLKGRQITKKDSALEVIEKALQSVQNIASLELATKLIGKKIIAQITPRK